MKTDLLSEALTGLRKVAFRQETVKFKKDFYVDGHIVDGLMGPNWQIVYGRRGTGKTTTLYALRDRINSEVNDLRSIAVYVDLTTCTPSDHGGSADTDAQRYAASLYFQAFIKKVCVELYESYTSADNRGLMQKLFLRDGVNKDRAEDIILDILDVVENGRYIQTPSTKTVL